MFLQVELLEGAFVGERNAHQSNKQLKSFAACDPLALRRY